MMGLKRVWIYDQRRRTKEAVRLADPQSGQPAFL